MTEDRYRRAMTLDAFVAATQKNAEFWHAATRLARADAVDVARAARLPGRWFLLALSEDWCSDAVSTLPALGRWCADASHLGAGLELRVLRRDQNADLMDAHLTRGTRSIPAVIVYDESFREVGWWGPRPDALQRWFYAEGLALERADRGKYLRAWYARDGGRTAVREVLALLEAIAATNGTVVPSA
jgi:hypothetical protein